MSTTQQWNSRQDTMSLMVIIFQQERQKIKQISKLSSILKVKLLRRKQSKKGVLGKVERVMYSWSSKYGSQGRSEKETFEQRSAGGERAIHEDTWGKNAPDKGNSKWECAQHVRRTARRPLWLHQSERGENGRKWDQQSKGRGEQGVWRLVSRCMSFGYVDEESLKNIEQKIRLMF